MADTTPDKIGWLFIQEYYNRLNSDPLHLYQFYTKQSTLIHGYEGENSQVAKGQQQVQNRVKQQKLFQDCTVYASTIDCLGSLEGGIVIQVTGEMHNVAGKIIKFAQTFFLAPSESQKGYYVLNDILRFLGESEYKDDEQDEDEHENEHETEPVQPKGSEGPKGAEGTGGSPGPSKQIPATVPAAAPAKEQKVQEKARAQGQPTAPSAAAFPKTSAKPSGSPAAAPTSSISASAPKKKIFYSAYLKNVVAEVDSNALHQALEKAGQVTHLQIETDKSRAFVDFIDQESLDRALEMQKIRIGNVNVVVEPRKRRKPTKQTGA